MLVGGVKRLLLNLIGGYVVRELYNEQKEDLYKLMLRGCTTSDIKDYCIENNIPYGMAKNFISEAHLHIKDKVSVG